MQKSNIFFFLLGSFYTKLNPGQEGCIWSLCVRCLSAWWCYERKL